MSTTRLANSFFEGVQNILSSTTQMFSDDRYRHKPQSYWLYNGSTWISSTPPSSSPNSNSTPSDLQSPLSNLNTIRLLSWNIDFMKPLAELRMARAIQHLHTLVKPTPPSTPVIIFLQEMVASDLDQLRSTPWIQSSFYITDIDTRANWPSPQYGTTTLVDRRLHIDAVFRVPWVSNFSRDGLFVDIRLRRRSSSEGTEEGNGAKTKVFRFCNTHLESLVANPPIRPKQIAAAAPYLHSSSPASSHVHASLLAGDLNAIEPFDRTLHTDHDLHDLYLSLGGEEDSDDGYTWGYQSPEPIRHRFGCSRMDKILYCGGAGGVAFERFGAGVEVEGEEGERMRESGDNTWVTDHYGVMGDFELDSGWEFVVSRGGGDGLGSE